MIRVFKVELNAAHPELPLMEATGIVGSPSAANIVGVPAKVGEWTIDSVFIRVSYPDASTITQEAAKSADGVWTATVPRCDVSGRVKCGFEILASGTDETGEPVSGYVLGIADFAVYTRDLEIKAGEKSVTLHYFDEPPASPAPGDVAPSGGVLSLYDGYTWLPFDARAYAAAVAAQNTADAAQQTADGAISQLPYSFKNPITTTDGSNRLFDRAVNIVAPETGEFVGLLYPEAVSGKSRDYLVYVAPGADFEGEIAFAKEYENTYFGDDFPAGISAGEKWLCAFTEIHPYVWFCRFIKLQEAAV